MSDHYLKKELYTLFQTDVTLFDFLQLSSLDGLWYWDLENPDHEWMSPEFWRLFGIDPEEKEHLAAEWQDIINPTDLQSALENFSKHCIDPSHPYDQVVRYQHKDGSTIWVRCRGVAIRDSTGKPVRMLGAHNNITEQKLVEQALREKTKELERVNEELRAANRKLETTLHGLLPICSTCKHIRDEKSDKWVPVETYVSHHSTAEFSHSYCPSCKDDLLAELSLLRTV